MIITAIMLAVVCVALLLLGRLDLLLLVLIIAFVLFMVLGPTVPNLADDAVRGIR